MLFDKIMFLDLLECDINYSAIDEEISAIERNYD